MSLETGPRLASFVPLHVVPLFIHILGCGVPRGAYVSSSCSGTIRLPLPLQLSEVLTQIHLIP